MLHDYFDLSGPHVHVVIVTLTNVSVPSPKISAGFILTKIINLLNLENTDLCIKARWIWYKRCSFINNIRAVEKPGST